MRNDSTLQGSEERYRRGKDGRWGNPQLLWVDSDGGEDWIRGGCVSDAPAGLFTAMKEQLGLKPEPTRSPVDVLVIDRTCRNTGI